MASRWLRRAEIMQESRARHALGGRGRPLERCEMIRVRPQVAAWSHNQLGGHLHGWLLHQATPHDASTTVVPSASIRTHSQPDTPGTRPWRR